MVDKPRRENAPSDLTESESLGPAVRRGLDSIVSLQADVPEDAFTASILGVKRSGSGVVIGQDGLVLTIGYLITEADSVWLTTARGRLVPAHALAVDGETGFGLVQALDRLDCPALDLGRSSEARIGDRVVIAAGPQPQFVPAAIVAKEEFAGYWEYLLDEAIFTAPAHPFWGGAGLLGADGKLLGVGSLHVEQESTVTGRRDVNMIVPIDLLPPILESLRLHGRVDRPARPWLGVYCAEAEGKIVVAGVAEGGPAAAAGMRRGDVITALGDASVVNLADFYRKLWSRGPAGVEAPIEIVREGRSLWLRARSIDRTALLKKPRLH